jgi:hypothetical protein
MIELYDDFRDILVELHHAGALICRQGDSAHALLSRMSDVTALVAIGRVARIARIGRATAIGHAIVPALIPTASEGHGHE